MSTTYTFYIDGMHCISCSKRLESHLKDRLAGKLQQFNADVTTADPKKTQVVLSDDKRENIAVWSELKQYIEEINFSCRAYEYPNLSISEKHPTQHTQINSLKNILAKAKIFFASHWLRGGLGCILGTAVLIACLGTGGLSLPFMIPIAIFSTLFTLILGANSYYEAWTKLTKTGILTMDSLFALSTSSILIVSIASLFVPWLPMMFEAGLLIYGFRHIGIAIEDTIKKKIGTTKFQDKTPQMVRVETPTVIKEVDITQINEGDVIIVRPGEMIPLDGICQNESTIYNTIITGTILPRYFPAHEKVLAGMRLADNAQPLKICVTKTHKNSYLARLDAQIEKASLEKAPIEIKTGQILTYFIPTVILFAITSGIVIGLFFPAAIAIQCAVSVLVSACPCTLGLITPIAVKTGMHKAAENGVQFKGAKTLQLAEKIDTVIFDLNGTLTTGVPVVKEFFIFEETKLSRQKFLSLCSALEEKSQHPIGKAIYSFANKESLQKLETTLREDSHHSGISGQIESENYTIGSMTLMSAKGISIPPQLKQPILKAGDQLVYVACGATVIGFMVLTDPLRHDALPTIKALKAMGKEIHLCTGADEDTAFRYAQALGIEKVYPNCIATCKDGNQKSKTAYVYALKKIGHTVAMVGDAGNDAEAIATSDIGIAVASEGNDKLTQQVQQIADIVIHKGALLSIASAFAISQQTVSNINQNLAMSLVYNLGSVLVSGGLLVGIGLSLNPAVCVGLMIFQACLILANVYRFKQQPLEHLKEDAEPCQEEFCLESSHSKINKHAPAHKKESFCEQSPSPHCKSYPFWSNYFPSKTVDNIEEAQVKLSSSPT